MDILRRDRPASKTHIFGPGYRLISSLSRGAPASVGEQSLERIPLSAGERNAVRQ
jgi:hypothetical protein